MAEKSKLSAKLLEVRKSVDYLQKEAEGKQFKYTSSSQVLVAVRNKMNELNLLLITRVVAKRVLNYENQKGVMVYFTELDLEMIWEDVDSGEQLIIPWYGQGVDLAGEKGVGKALTYAEKYFILKQFNIPTDKDDPDAFQEKNTSSDDKKAAQEKRKADLLTKIGKTVKLEDLTKIWESNIDLQKDKEFKAAVAKKGEKIKNTADPKDKPKDEPKDETEKNDGDTKE
jgi:hypothetical protein